MKVGVKSNFGRWMLTSSLKMTEQINMTCQSVYYHLHNIRQIRKFLMPASTKLLVQGVIMTGIDYFNGLLYGVPAVRLSKLQRLQYSAARLITHTPRYCHITPLLLALHWLPVKFRICHKIAVISSKTIHNMGPAFLSNLINIKQCSRYNLRSIVALFCKTLPLSSNVLLGTYSLRQLQTYGTVYRTILGKRMILICLRDSLRRSILKRPIATCLKLL